MNTRIAEIFALVKEFNIERLKKEVSTYLQDSSISEEERFEVWANTPEELRTFDDITFYAVGLDGKEICWYSDYYGEERDKQVGLQLMRKGLHGFINDW